MKELIAYINLFQQLDGETEEAVRNCFVEEQYGKNEMILEEGKTCNRISFIQSGLVRRFHITNGVDITKWIYHQGHWFTSLSSYIHQRPGLEYFQACEKTILFSLSAVNEEQLLQFPLFLKFYTRFLRCSLAAFDEFHFVFGTMPATRKYDYLIDKFPLMIQKAKQKHIASLLNISQETLSRIRAAAIS
jgi:CRP-like cAMP-binding protein